MSRFLLAATSALLGQMVLAANVGIWQRISPRISFQSRKTNIIVSSRMKVLPLELKFFFLQFSFRLFWCRLCSTFIDSIRSSLFGQSVIENSFKLNKANTKPNVSLVNSDIPVTETNLPHLFDLFWISSGCFWLPSKGNRFLLVYTDFYGTALFFQISEVDNLICHTFNIFTHVYTFDA